MTADKVRHREVGETLLESPQKSPEVQNMWDILLISGNKVGMWHQLWG